MILTFNQRLGRIKIYENSITFNSVVVYGRLCPKTQQPNKLKELEWIVITEDNVKSPTLIVPQAEVLKLKELEWIVITEDNVAEVWQRLTEKKVDVVLFGITDEGYEIMARNMSDIMAHIEQQKAIIASYKNYYEESEQAIDQANKDQSAINNEIDKVNTQNPRSIRKLDWWDTPINEQPYTAPKSRHIVR